MKFNGIPGIFPIYVLGSGPPGGPSPSHGHGFPLHCVDVGAASIVWLPPWMRVPPVDVSLVRSVWFAPFPLWIWVFFVPYTK